MLAWLESWPHIERILESWRDHLCVQVRWGLYLDHRWEGARECICAQNKGNDSTDRKESLLWSSWRPCWSSDWSQHLKTFRVGQDLQNGTDDQEWSRGCEDQEEKLGSEAKPLLFPHQLSAAAQTKPNLLPSWWVLPWKGGKNWVAHSGQQPPRFPLGGECQHWQWNNGWQQIGDKVKFEWESSFRWTTTSPMRSCLKEDGAILRSRKYVWMERVN